MAKNLFVRQGRLETEEPLELGCWGLVLVQEHAVLELDEVEEGGGESGEHPGQAGVQLGGGQLEQVGLQTQLCQYSVKGESYVVGLISE